MVEILDALEPRPDVVSLLLTGNTVDGDDRSGIARRALTVAAEHTGGAVDPRSTFVIGDTPHDVRCGNEIGARTVAVASGSYALDELANEDPWLALERLPTPARFGELLMLDG